MKLSKSEILRLYSIAMLRWKQRKRQILPVNQNLSSKHFLLAKFQLVSCKLSLAIIWQMTYRKILKISPGAYIFQRPFLRGLFSEGLIYGRKFAFQNRLASLIVGSKFTVFALFYFVFEGNFPSTGEGQFNRGFLCYQFGDLIFGGAYTWYTWRGLFLEFYGILTNCQNYVQPP